MANFPNGVRFVLAGFQEEEDPSVLRTEMERGVPIQRVINEQVMCKISGTIQFENAEAIEAFDDWYFDTIKRIDWFDFRHPRTRVTVRARFIGGKRGPLAPVTGGWGIAQRAAELEYMR